jgi:hypothetical protein
MTVFIESLGFDDPEGANQNREYDNGTQHQQIDVE